jgi:hypothetical protein
MCDAADPELDELAGDFPGWRFWRSNGWLRAESREDEGRQYSGKSAGVLRMHVANACFPVLRPGAIGGSGGH